MLKLKKVQLLGFKSFCDRTELHLSGEGIVAVVGPNGCGKSNIADAITWVLGEQSAKSLRGLKMEDVIFAGTRDRKPMGMAEVSLTLIDPEVYDGPPDSSLTPEGSMYGAQSGDWDEAALRRDREAETEEAISEAQPGTHLPPKVDAGDAASTGEPTAEPAGDVVFKIRRRKFGRSPIRTGELIITRRLFRTGESEYLLNGKICRLRDIQDIFMGTGLGGESYAIIGQERIGQLLSAKPQDRRSIIEEAAGITRFKTRKRLAELRLEAARQNLARINDIFEEVSKQLGSLKRQAAKAERYGQIRSELRSKLRVVLASRLQEMDQEHAAGSVKVVELTASVDTRAGELEAADAEHSLGVQRGYDLERRIREHASVANQSAVELERLVARTVANQERIEDLTTRIAAGDEEAHAAAGQVAHLVAEQEQQKLFLQSANADAQDAREQAQAQQRSAQAALQATQVCEQQAEAARRGAMQLMQRASSARNEHAQAEAALAALERESERLVAESTTARTELAALGLQHGQAKLSFESVNDRLRRLEVEMAELRLAIEANRSEEIASKREGDRLRGEIASLNGRRNSLEGLIRDHSYSSETVKSIFRAGAKLSRESGQVSATLGTLADFLEVDGAYEQVVDEFLRDELSYIVVKDWNAADEGIRLLRSEVAGRATFLVQVPESADLPRRQRVPVPQQTDLRPLTECVRVLQGLGPLVEALLPKFRDGFVVAGVETARTLAAQHPEAYFLATTGETFHLSTVTGGRPSSGGPLALKRELREVEGKLIVFEKELDGTAARTSQLQRQLADQTAALDARHLERREVEREAANSGAALRQMESESSRIERRLQDWTLSTERNRTARELKSKLIEDLQGQVAAIDAEAIQQEAVIARLGSDLEEARRRREELQQSASTSAAALAAMEERRRNALANFEQTTRLLNGQQQRLAQLKQQLESAATERLRREQETAELSERHTVATEARVIALAEGERLSSEAGAQREIIAALDVRLRALRHEIESLREQRSSYMARLARLGSDIEHLEAACSNDLALPPDEIRQDPAVERISGDLLNDLEADAKSLKQRLEAMGPVNMMALEEYQETVGRHTFLETQRQDLLDSIENTRSSIKEIDDVSSVKFDEAFTVINQNFGVTFAKLFGGGQALMRLTEDENRGEAGIEIVASPPGKKLQNILLLSGGEKALTALSLLVGIFQFQPAPFCILDEVDAPLDETNVGRYAEMISELSSNTQFIAITHSRRTMQQADVIYGVTMQEPGVSKFVSVTLGRGNRSRSQQTGEQDERRVA